MFSVRKLLPLLAAPAALKMINPPATLAISPSPSKRTHVLTIKPGPDRTPITPSPFRISYTCDVDTPAVVEYIIYDIIGTKCTAKVFSGCTDYYDVTVNRILMRKYGKDFNLTFRYIELVY